MQLYPRFAKLRLASNFSMQLMSFFPWMFWKFYRRVILENTPAFWIHQTTLSISFQRYAFQLRTGSRFIPVPARLRGSCFNIKRAKLFDIQSGCMHLTDETCNQFVSCQARVRQTRTYLLRRVQSTQVSSLKLMTQVWSLMVNGLQLRTFPHISIYMGSSWLALGSQSLRVPCPSEIIFNVEIEIDEHFFWADVPRDILPWSINQIG